MKYLKDLTAKEWALYAGYLLIAFAGHYLIIHPGPCCGWWC